MVYRKRYPFIYDGILDPQICKRRAGIRIWTGYGLVRLPSEQEAARKLLSEESSSVRIFISDSIRIEISDSCRPELMESILGFLQCHAWPGRRNNGISCLRSHWSEKKLQWSGCHHQIKISPRPILMLHVCVLQPSAYFYKDPPMGRIRILDPDETARP